MAEYTGRDEGMKETAPCWSFLFNKDCTRWAPTSFNWSLKPLQNRVISPDLLIYIIYNMAIYTGYICNPMYNWIRVPAFCANKGHGKNLMPALPKPPAIFHSEEPLR